MDMICRRLLAALYPDYEYLSTQVITQVGPHSFRTQGQTPLAEGWRALYREEKAEGGKGAKGEKEEAQTKLPALQEGDTRKVEKVGKKRCKTKPPAPHTDASLLGLMEHAGRMIEDEALRESMKESGLGTPATRAAILERLIQVGYVVRKGKTLTATDKAQAGAGTPRSWPPGNHGEMGALPEPHGQGGPGKSCGSAADSSWAASAGSAPFWWKRPRRRTPRCACRRRNPGPKGGAPQGGERPGPALPCAGREVTASQKAFGCSRWREGCRFTIWRDALTRQGGPSLTVNHMKKLLDGQTLTLDGLAVSLAQGGFRRVGTIHPPGKPDGCGNGSGGRGRRAKPHPPQPPLGGHRI